MRLYVGNIPYTTTESELTEWFAESGITVDSLSIARDRFSGESRGFGFVEIDDPSAAEQAINTCNGRDCQGRSLVVNEARPMRERAPRAGGGGGGRDRGGRGRGGNRW